MKTINFEEKEKQNVKIATIVSTISIVLNLLLGITKIVIGQIMNFSSVMSDGIHSTGDVLISIIALISVYFSSIKKDEKYNYGRERFGAIAAIVLSVILFISSITIIEESITELINFTGTDGTIVNSPLFYTSLGLAIASIILKEIMFYITIYGAKKAHSSAMKVDAWHQRLDALSSIMTIIALCCYYFLPDNNILDPILSFPIAIMIIILAVKTFITNSRILSDHSIDKQELDNIKKALSQIISSSDIAYIKSHLVGEKYYLDISIYSNKETTLAQLKEQEKNIIETLMSSFSAIKDINITYQIK